MEKMKAISPYLAGLRSSPVAIVVVADTEHEKAKGFWVQDCSAACENIYLACEALGLKTCWCGLYPLEERIEAAQKFFGLEKQFIPFCIMPLGHPKETKAAKPRFNAERVHMGKW